MRLSCRFPSLLRQKPTCEKVPTPSATEDMGERFMVENYLYHVGASIASRFDANSYLYLSRAANIFNLSDGYTSLEEALSRIKSRMLFMGSSSDILFPAAHVRQLTEKVQACGVDARYRELQTPLGHYAFLVDGDQTREALWSFMET
jgi:homoserine O-acetyltransferase/O-succinyltransferase